MAGTRSQLRDETGALIGGLVVEDYTQGMADFEAGAEWPDGTSASYDLGRQRAAEQAAEKRQVTDWLAKREAEGRERMKAVLTPEQFADYESKMAEIDTRYPRRK